MSSAIEEDNPDLAKAKALGVRVVHRAEMLAEVVGDQPLIAISGTSGKTTVTAMVGWVLSECGLNPTVVNGGEIVGWERENHVGSVRCGRKDLWVLEVDESDKSLLRFRPDWAIVTNISQDHFDLDETTDLFRMFVSSVKEKVIYGPGAAKQLGVSEKPASEVPVRVGDHWEWLCEGEWFRVPLAGEHNAWNASLAARLCLQFDLTPSAVRDALARFPGVRRRLEEVGVAGGVRVVDDYAHNTAKIRAALLAVQTDGGKTCAVWRPHGFGPLAAMQKDLTVMFSELLRSVDMLFVLPVYYVGGTTTRAVTSERFVEGLQAQGVSALAVRDYGDLQERLLGVVSAGDVVLCMGARDPELPIFARTLVHTLGCAE